MSTDCSYCGAYVSGGLAKCPACGKRVKATTSQPQRDWDRASEYTPDFSGYNQGAYKENSYDANSSGAAYQREEQDFASEAYNATRHAAQNSQSYQNFSQGYQNFTDRQRTAQNPQKGYNAEEKEKLKQSYQEFIDEQKRAAQSPNTGSRYEFKPIYYLCYLGIFSIIPYFLDQQDKFAKFHSNQGVVLFLILIVTSITGFLAPIGTIFFIYGLIQGLKSVHDGVMKPLPLIGNIQILK